MYICMCILHLKLRLLFLIICADRLHSCGQCKFKHYKVREITLYEEGPALIFYCNNIANILV